MDMESIVTDSHDLMMSEEQQHHLYKVSVSFAFKIADYSRLDVREAGLENVPHWGRDHSISYWNIIPDSSDCRSSMGH